LSQSNRPHTDKIYYQLQSINKHDKAVAQTIYLGSIPMQEKEKYQKLSGE